MDIINCHPSEKRGDTVRDKRHGPTRQRFAAPLRQAQPIAVDVMGRWPTTLDENGFASLSARANPCHDVKRIGDRFKVASTAVTSDPEQQTDPRPF
jgi:hypothetical protein